MSPEERVLREVRAWAPRFTAGDVKVHALLKPALRPGERWGVKLTGIGVSQVPAADPFRAIDGEAPLLGLAYGTSERLLVANGRSVKHAWEWSELSEVLLLPSYLGVLLHGDSETSDAVHRVRVPHDLFPLPPWKAAARWLQLEGCFAASRGRLDVWLDGLAARGLAS